LHLAGFVDLPFSSSFGIQLGVGYSEKGGESSSSSDPVFWQNHIGYLDLPVLLTYQPFSGSRWAPHFLLGPTLSIKTSCSIRTEAPGFKHESDCGGGTAEPRTTDLGATAGVGATYDLRTGFAVGMDALYTHGLRTVPDAEDGVKNRVFTLALTVAFPLRGRE
jgi:hypothetical protein